MAHTPPAGTLAGSTVLLLSLAWGASVILGRCDISDTTGRAVDKTLTRGAGAMRAEDGDTSRFPEMYLVICEEWRANPSRPLVVACHFE